MNKSTIVLTGQVWLDRDVRQREGGFREHRYVRVIDVSGNIVELQRCKPDGALETRYPRTSTTIERLQRKFTFIASGGVS